MLEGIHVEVLLAASYTVFLAGVAFLLEWLARHSHKRAEHYRNSGFVYHHKLDMWDCPAGRQLTRIEVDYKHNIVRYRAPANACNACSLKINCTDSDEGRLLESRMDSWLESELRKFHRGISLVLLFLATMILLVEMARHASPRELLLTVILLLPIGIAETKLFTSFFNLRRRT